MSRHELVNQLRGYGMKGGLTNKARDIYTILSPRAPNFVTRCHQVRFQEVCHNWCDGVCIDRSSRRKWSNTWCFKLEQSLSWIIHLHSGFKPNNVSLGISLRSSVVEVQEFLQFQVKSLFRTHFFVLSKAELDSLMITFRFCPELLSLFICYLCVEIYLVKKTLPNVIKECAMVYEWSISPNP